MTEQILSRLLCGQSVSGQALSEELGVTRAAVWKQISQLREMGFEIEACGGQGYRLVSCPDLSHMHISEPTRRTPGA